MDDYQQSCIATTRNVRFRARNFGVLARTWIGSRDRSILFLDEIHMRAGFEVVETRSEIATRHFSGTGCRNLQQAPLIDIEKCVISRRWDESVVKVGLEPVTLGNVSATGLAIVPQPIA
jgi:hypothetical protein